MPQLDRVLPHLESGAATQIILEEGAQIRCVTGSGVQPLTAQTLSRAQVLNVVAEVGSPDDQAAISAAEEIRFLYKWNDARWLVQQDTTAKELKLIVRKWVEKASTPDLPPASPQLDDPTLFGMMWALMPDKNKTEFDRRGAEADLPPGGVLAVVDNLCH